MISSEVQRTLVKSPPELWTELSDPDSLARHLGALGEIRITRAETEKRVDWEAERTTGSILIKPSGWGTKVTLSVTRELAPPQADADGEAAADVESETAPTAQTPAEGVAKEPDAEEDATAAPPAPLDRHAPESAPHVAVERIADADASPRHGAEAPAEAELLAATDPQAQPHAPTPVLPEPQAEPQPVEQEAKQAASEPRRGFFARLFGLHRGVKVELAPQEPEARTHSSFTAAAAVAAQEDGTTVEHPQLAARSAIESLQARFAPEPPATASASAEPSSATPAEPRDEATPEPQTQTQPQPQASERSLAPDRATRPLEEPAAEAVEAARSEDPRASRATELAAELEAAEEVAAQEVTAVLTAVLDRLGAAHHRPFSRA
jgi:hypothetical protein